MYHFFTTDHVELIVDKDDVDEIIIGTEHSFVYLFVKDREIPFHVIAGYGHYSILDLYSGEMNIYDPALYKAYVNKLNELMHE